MISNHSQVQTPSHHKMNLIKRHLTKFFQNDYKNEGKEKRKNQLIVVNPKSLIQSKMNLNKTYIKSLVQALFKAD